MRKVNARYSLIEKQPSKDCIFLSKNGQSKGCEIYPVRPLQCRTWPFWRENLSSENVWTQTGRDCPGMGQGKLHSYEVIENIRRGKLTTDNAPQNISIEQSADRWINDNKNNQQALRAVEELYHIIDQHISGVNPACDNCGRCCDFANYGHRLYVTTLEMLYFRYGGNHHDNDTNITKEIKMGRCPYQNKQGCSRRSGRPAGCRIYFCKELDQEFQNDLTEIVLERLKNLHLQFEAVYLYADFLTWLQTTCR